MASTVFEKHLRVRLHEATTAVASSTIRYFAWYLTTGSVYGAIDAPVACKASHSFFSFFGPPFAREVTRALTATPREAASASASNTASSLQRNNDKEISRFAFRMTSRIVSRRSASEVTMRVTGVRLGPARWSWVGWKGNGPRLYLNRSRASPQKMGSLYTPLVSTVHYGGLMSARIAAVVALLVCAPLTVVAQSRTGVIGGTVTTDEGKRLAGVSVTVENDVSGLRRTATTDAEGQYSIANLPVDGEYVVRVALAGFATVANEKVGLVANGRTVVDFVLKLTMRETVAVTAESPIAETHQSTVQQTVSDNLVHTLPLLGRNFLPLASLAAGFTGNPNFPSPQGQIYWSNNVLVDGASHFSKWRSAPRTFYSGYSLETIKEVHILTNRFSAEYGEALATVTSAVTKGGDDQLRGSALLFVQDSALNEPPEFSPFNPPSSTERYGFTIGGPFVKGQTHFLESYEGHRARNNNAVISPAADGQIVPDNEDEHLEFFRVDHRLGNTHFLTSRYNGQFFRWHNEPGGLTLPGSGTQYVNDVH